MRRQAPLQGVEERLTVVSSFAGGVLHDGLLPQMPTFLGTLKKRPSAMLKRPHAVGQGVDHIGNSTQSEGADVPHQALSRTRKIALAALVISAPISLNSFATPNGAILSERELRAECSYEMTGVRECLQEKHRASEVNLKRVEKNARESLDKWDEDPRYIKATRARLVASREAFIKYRETQCAFASSLGGGAIGNALEVQRLACVAELNNRRAEQLRDAVSDLPVK